MNKTINIYFFAVKQTPMSENGYENDNESMVDDLLYDPNKDTFNALTGEASYFQELLRILIGKYKILDSELQNYEDAKEQGSSITDALDRARRAVTEKESELRGLHRVIELATDRGITLEKQNQKLSIANKNLLKTYNEIVNKIDTFQTECVTNVNEKTTQLQARDNEIALARVQIESLNESIDNLNKKTTGTSKRRMRQVKHIFGNDVARFLYDTGAGEDTTPENGTVNLGSRLVLSRWYESDPGPPA